MKLFTKAALGALMLAGAAIGTSAPAAAAHVSAGIGIGVPGSYYGPGYGPGYYGPPVAAYCDRYSRWYDPYRCNAYDDYSDGYAYGGPVFVDGIFFGGGYGHGWHGGHGGGWGGHSGSWGGHGGGWGGHGGGGGHHH
jgi:hypothetical protein